MASRPLVSMEDTLQLLQSTLVINKSGVPVDSLNREYKNVVGDNIPFKQLGFRDIREFLDHAGSVCRVVPGPNGSQVAVAMSCEENSHIAQMIKMQKSSKKPRPNPQRRPLSNEYKWQPPAHGQQQSTKSSNFQHGFRANGFKPGQVSSGRFPDQRTSPGGSGRFPGGRVPRGFSGPPRDQRLRAPQNLSQGGAVPRGVHQAPVRPMSQRLSQTSQPSQRPMSPKFSVSHVKILEDYFTQKGLGVPEFKTSKMEQKVGGRSKKVITKYCSTVKVENESFRTYPMEYDTEKEAQDAVAKLACDKLSLKGQSNSQPPFPVAQTAPADISIDVMIDRLLELVDKRTNGVWSHKLETEYVQKFGRPLPENWTEKIENYQKAESVTQRVTIERPMPDRCIVIPIVFKASSQEDQPSVRKENVLPMPVSSSVPMLATTTQKSSLPAQPIVSQLHKLPELVLPEDDIWDVYVTHIFSTVEVCIRILGPEHSKKFEDLITDIELHYYDVDKIPKISQPVIGKIYAAHLEGEWQRVEVVSVKGVDVTCYLIDDGGDHVVIGVNAMREIDPKFLRLAAQAKRVRLAGLEEFAENQEASNELRSAALARSLVGQVYSRSNDQDISLILIDTSGENTDININQMLLEKLKPNSGAAAAIASPTQNGASSNSPSSEISQVSMDLMSLDLASLKPLLPARIPDEGQFFDVLVTLAASPSNFTIQPYQESAELERLMNSMKEFYDDKSRNQALKPEDLSKDNYFAALHTDGLWYRVKISARLDEHTLAVKIVDYGDITMVPLENLQPLWPQFRNLPMQAINATLAGIVAAEGDWTMDATVWFAQRVANNAFVSLIKDVVYDEAEQNIRLSLSLIDTSHPSKDVYIEKELVDSKWAVYLCI